MFSIWGGRGKGFGMNEVALAALLCSFLSGGTAEQPHGFDNLGGVRRVRVDCETADLVMEVGLDRRASARDSVHQAVFAAALTGKRPIVVLIDTDGVEGRYEQETRVVTGRLGIAYATCTEDFIVAWAATAGLRRSTAGDDLPDDRTARACGLGRILGAGQPGS